MTNKMTASGSLAGGEERAGRPVGPGVRCPVPSQDAPANSPLKPRPAWLSPCAPGAEGGARASLLHDGHRLPEIKQPQLHPTCADLLFSKALSDGFTSPRALLKDVKISNHHKVNISKLALFKISHIFKNPLNSSSPRTAPHHQPPCPILPTSFALFGFECFSLI